MFPSLPNPTGPFVVGVADIETDQVLLRLFYPARVSPAPSFFEPKPSWLISLAYARGYGDFLKVPAVVSIPLFGAFFSGVKIPHALQDAPVLPAKNEEGGGEKRLPLVILSHGLGGMRTTYTAVCNDLASHGFIVASVEHRDYSASMTLRNDSQERLEYKPLPTDVDEYQFRNGQVKQRVAEVVKVYDLMKALDDGSATPANKISSSKFPLSSLKNRIDFNQVAALGHSFGGATAIQAAYYHSDLFHCSICLDGWMFPVNKEVFQEEKFPGEARPVFFLNSELFQWEENLKAMKALVQKTNSATSSGTKVLSSVMKILGSAHQNQSDFSVLAPSFVLRSAKMLGPMDPQRCLQINNRACLVFLQRCLGWENPTFAKDTILERGSAERPAELVFDDDDEFDRVDLSQKA